ncbi:hypothetical protein GJ496_008655 [Pomphorhynchus laevis]|nr:hypothetical protein GJ496_008655 [Pomphorhynchus laevis]
MAHIMLSYIELIPFNLTIAVAASQLTMNQITENEKLSNEFSYVVDVIVCGRTQVDQDKNLNRFLDRINKYDLTLNRQKSVFGTDIIHFLGYEI